MENKNSYTIVGVFFVACLLFFGSFAWWLGVKREKGVQYESYFLHINELPGGIKDGTQVKFSGIDAGFVKSVGFDKNGDQIEIILYVKSQMPVRKDSVARVETQGISGISTINISKGSGQFFAKGEERVLRFDVGLFNKIGSQAATATQNLNSILDKINTALTQQNLENLSETTTNLNKFIANLSDDKNLKNINEILSNIDQISAKFADENGTIDRLNLALKSIDDLTQNLNTLTLNLNRTATQIARSNANGEYNLKAFLMPPIEDFRATLSEFRRVVRELNDNLNELSNSPINFILNDTKTKEIGVEK